MRDLITDTYFIRRELALGLSVLTVGLIILCELTIVLRELTLGLLILFEGGRTELNLGQLVLCERGLGELILARCECHVEYFEEFGAIPTTL